MKNKWRLAVGFRELNAATVLDVFSLPLIDDMLERQGRRRCFSVIDLKHGFFQIPLAEEDRPKTAFETPNGLYQWRVMPMCLKNAPSPFQRVMTELLRHLPCAAYLFTPGRIFLLAFLCFFLCKWWGKPKPTRREGAGGKGTKEDKTETETLQKLKTSKGE